MKESILQEKARLVASQNNLKVKLGSMSFQDKILFINNLLNSSFESRKEAIFSIEILKRDRRGFYGTEYADLPFSSFIQDTFNITLNQFNRELIAYKNFPKQCEYFGHTFIIDAIRITNSVVSVQNIVEELCDLEKYTKLTRAIKYSIIDKYRKVKRPSRLETIDSDCEMCDRLKERIAELEQILEEKDKKIQDLIDSCVGCGSN